MVLCCGVFSHHHTLPVLSLLNNMFSDVKRTWLYRKVKKKFAKRPNLPFSLQIFGYGNGLFMHQAYFGTCLIAWPNFDALHRVPPHVFFVTELNSKTDLQSLSGKTLSATSGSSSPGPVPATSTLLCPYVNLLLCNAQPSGEEHFGHFFFFFFVGRWFVSTCNVFLISRNIKYVLDCLRIFRVFGFHSIVRHSSSFAQ